MVVKVVDYGADTYNAIYNLPVTGGGSVDECGRLSQSSWLLEAL